MENTVFILASARTWARTVRIFRKNKKGKFFPQYLKFTTEHLVSSAQRDEAYAKTRNAEYATSDPDLIEEIYRDTAYGIDFYEVGDPQGKKKKEPYNISGEDAEIIGLANLFEMAGLPFDGSKPIDVLKSELKLHSELLSGKKIKDSKPLGVTHTPVDVASDIEKQKEDARVKYEEKYGEDVPAIVYNDVAFLSAILGNEKFDAKAYIAKKSQGPDGVVEKVEETGEAELTGDELLAKYKEVIGKNVPNFKKNAEDWIRGKIAEAEK